MLSGTRGRPPVAAGLVPARAVHDQRGVRAGADGAAIRAALTEAWSSGQAEGQVNRLKLLKRQSCGGASFDLLRQRVPMAA